MDHKLIFASVCLKHCLFYTFDNRCFVEKLCLMQTKFIFQQTLNSFILIITPRFVMLGKYNMRYNNDLLII